MEAPLIRRRPGTGTIVQAALAAMLGLALVLAITAMQPARSEESTPPPQSAVTAPAATIQETVDNPYGIAAIWQGGDWVARGTLIALVIMSMGSWTIILTKLIEQSVLLHQA